MKTIPKLLIALFTPLAALATPVTYTIDSLHSFPNFSVNHMNMTMVHGRFERMTGRITLEESRNLLRAYEEGLAGYTYLERE